MVQKYYHNLLLIFIFSVAGVCLAQATDDYVRTSGTKLLGRNGMPIVLRGTNCGNWMVREPYMMNTSNVIDRQYKFDNLLAEVCGEEKVQEFDKLWLDNNFGEADMKLLAEQGFNNLRVPMHYKYFTLPIEKEPVAGEQTWLQEGFNRVDSMCKWAERYGILLILDMHACPGGQSAGDICDYDETKPSLWESEENRTKLIALWRKIAERYKGEKCVAAYDLINETNWTLANSNKLLWDTFKNIINAIREVDTEHIIILEGNNYSSSYTGMPSSLIDNKTMLQFHRYAAYCSSSAVQGMATLGTKYNCPIYVGEFGENSNSWTASFIRLFEEGMNFAGWSCWPMKKSNLNSILQVKRVSKFDTVISQIKNGTTPSASTLWEACKAWAEAQNINNCTVRKDYIDALLRRPFTKECIPYTTQEVGDYIFAPNYDMGPVGLAYWDKDEATYHFAGESYTTWQKGGNYRNDGVDIYTNANDTKTCSNLYVGETKDGEWLQYTIENPNEAASWTLQLRYATKVSTSVIRITVNDRTVAPSTTLYSTGDYTTWSTKYFRNIILPKGTLRVRLYLEKGGMNLNWLRFTSKKNATEEELAVLKPNEAADRNHLSNSECEYQGAWRTAALGSINNTKYTWNSTTNIPTNGEGGALCISNTREHSLNTVVYQPVEVIEGHYYSTDVAVRGTEGNKNFWIQAFMLTEEPKDYTDQGLEEAYTIGQLNSTKDATLATYDGWMSAKAKAGTSHYANAMKWKAPYTGTAYFALKVGSSNTSFSYTFDNFTIKDQTAIKSGIVAPQSNESLYTLNGNKLTINTDCKVYNIKGEAVNAGYMPSGIYIITNGKQSQKVKINGE